MICSIDETLVDPVFPMVIILFSLPTVITMLVLCRYLFDLKWQLARLKCLITTSYSLISLRNPCCKKDSFHNDHISHVKLLYRITGDYCSLKAID